MTVSTNPTENPPTESTQNSEIADLQARIAQLEASLQAETDSKNAETAKVEELRKRNSLLRNQTGSPGPELRKHLLAEVEARQAELADIRNAIRKNPSDSSLGPLYDRCKRAVKAAVDELSAQFPTAEPTRRELTQEQIRKRDEIESEFAAAKAAWGGVQSRFVELSRYERANKARRDFYKKHGLQLPTV